MEFRKDSMAALWVPACPLSRTGVNHGARLFIRTSVDLPVLGSTVVRIAGRLLILLRHPLWFIWYLTNIWSKCLFRRLRRAIAAVVRGKNTVNIIEILAEDLRKQCVLYFIFSSTHAEAFLPSIYKKSRQHLLHISNICLRIKGTILT